MNVSKDTYKGYIIILENIKSVALPRNMDIARHILPNFDIEAFSKIDPQDYGVVFSTFVKIKIN